ncbi:Conserved hypothetical protein [gamma proteobacterium HdN1]|nr:Conserved hypothetical protein [gamma proteobacterium HdN1]
MVKKFRLLFSNFTLLLIAVVVLAAIAPVEGRSAEAFEHLTTAAIVLLFFMHGAKLSRRAIWEGITHWRLHLLVFAITFAIFPLLGMLFAPALAPFLGWELTAGVLFLCALPGTVQSAIAFTSIARGNIPAAVCSASTSSIIGIVLTPLLFSVAMGANHSSAGSLSEAILHIGEVLLLPFTVGHLLRPWVGAFIFRQAKLLSSVDQGSILLIVFTAFSESVVAGLWKQMPLPPLLWLTLFCCILLALVLLATTALSRKLGFNKEDEIAIVFCGSKKSLATGVPMAQIMFGSGAAGVAMGSMLLPIMIFHQIQLMVCAVLAERYAARSASDQK